ncbi:hypothetical protein MMC17_008385 [Xylographa soralifera]|nr:hypothetical protein [Xylographa soralifera]
MQDGDKLPRFLMISTPPALAANRISHFFDLRGASLTLDTGCSSGLVALHQAVLGLRANEADMTVVSGCNLMLSPNRFKILSSLGMLSPDGRSYAFNTRANGYGRGEGVVTVIIKRLRASVNYDKPNPKLELDKWGLRVATALEPWPALDGAVRRAFINNFGYGGTNSHIILEDGRLAHPQPGLDGLSKLSNGSAQISHTTKNEALVFYGRDEQASERMIAGVKQYLQRHRDTTSPARLMRNLGWTLAKHRTRFPTG